MVDKLVVWGEADVRDCMKDFDPRAREISHPADGLIGLRGTGGGLIVYSYWSMGSYTSVYGKGLDDGSWDGGRRFFPDVIEGIVFAIEFLSKEKWG